jgi:predicted DNA-binding transcriptional regulator
MKILIKNIDKKTYFRVLLELLRIKSPFNELPSRALDVFAYILYYYNEIDNKNTLFYHLSRKVPEICRELNISKGVYYNQLYVLRKHGILEEHEINEKYLLKFYNSITFDFILK